MAYNGWTNKETWLINVHYMDTIRDDIENGYIEPYETPSALRDHIEDMAHDFEGMEIPVGGIFQDFIAMCFADADWYQLFESLKD